MGPSLSTEPLSPASAATVPTRQLLLILSMVRYRFFLYAGLLPYLLGAAWAYGIVGVFDAAIFWSGLAGVVLAVIGVEAFNEYFDSRMGTDRVFNPQDVPAISAWVLCVRDGRFRRCAGGRGVLVCPGWLADPRICAARGRGGDLLRGAASTLGLPGARGDSDRALIRTMDGAGKPLLTYAHGVERGPVGLAGSGSPDHGAGGGQRDSRFPPGSPRRQAQSRCSPGAASRRVVIRDARRRGLFDGRDRCDRGRFPKGVPRRSPGATVTRGQRASRYLHVRVPATVCAGHSQHRCLLPGRRVAVHHGRRSCMPGISAPRAYRIDSLKAPLFVSWQITRDCDLSCVHCSTGSAPGKRLPDELDAEESVRVAEELIDDDVPYVMLCGGEPLVVPHFLALADRLGRAGIQLKIETNGQQLDPALADRLARLPVRSVQISLDGDTQAVYARQRPGASLEKAHAACRAVRAAGLPLEVTFAPTRLNIHEAPAVIERAVALGRISLQHRAAHAHRYCRAPMG